MKISLIGYTGLIGKNIIDNYNIDYLYNSKNIESFKDTEHELVFCAAPSAEKWKANLEPYEDMKSINKLIDSINKTKIKKFVLFSTVDIYGNQFDVDENFKNDIRLLHPYGKNRYIFEDYILNNFESHIIRLPALFGKYLKKNILFDLINDNNLNNISINTKYQWFYLNRLKEIVDYTINNKISVINCTSEPIETVDIIDKYFLNKKHLCLAPNKISYNIKTVYNKNSYLYTKKEIENDLKLFLMDYVNVLNN